MREVKKRLIRGAGVSVLKSMRDVKEDKIKEGKQMEALKGCLTDKQTFNICFND